MAMTRQNIIEILLKYTTQGAEKANAVARKTNQAITTQQRGYADANKETKRGIDATRNNMVANSRAGQVMRMNQQVLGNFNKEGRTFNTAGARMANRFRMMTHGARGFRMEMLGVMFFGMAMQRLFTGLIKTSLEWMGVNEILTSTLGVLFLPVAELLLDWALKFLDWVLQLTESQKKTIGWFVLVGAVVGTLTFLIGTLALGIGSMILAFNFSKVATIIGGAGLGGISAAAGTAATKVGGLTSGLGKFAKYGGTAIALSIAVKDLTEGQVTAAVGMGTLAVGIYTGNPYLIGVGLVLKLIGDEEFAIKFYKVIWEIIDFVATAGENIGKLLSGVKFKDIDWGSFDAPNKALNELYQNGEITSEKLQNLAQDVTFQDFSNQLNDINEEYNNGNTELNETMTALSDLSKEYEITIGKAKELAGAMNMFDPKRYEGRSMTDVIPTGNIWEELKKTQVRDFILQPGGRLIETDPNDTIMGSKSGFGGAGNISVSPIYNVIVSDKSEFESMLEENNRQLTEDVRRLTA